MKNLYIFLALTPWLISLRLNTFQCIESNGFFQIIFQKQSVIPLNPIKIEHDSVNQKINIEFLTTDIIYNLLVRVGEAGGQTIFLDNQYKYSGHYKREINVKSWTRGTYLVDVILDNNKTNKSIKIDGGSK